MYGWVLLFHTKARELIQMKICNYITQTSKQAITAITEILSGKTEGKIYLTIWQGVIMIFTCIFEIKVFLQFAYLVTQKNQ